MKMLRTLDTLGMKARTTVHRRMHLMLRPLAEPIPEPAPRGAFTYEEMTPDTEPAYLAMLPSRRALVETRLASGARCFLAMDGEHIAHGYWMGVGRVRIDYMERDLVLPPDSVYTYDSYSPPAHRGRGLAQAVGLHVMRLARDEGRRRAWCLPAVENAAGIRPVEAIGYRRVADFHCLRLGPWRRHWTVSLADVEPLTLEPPASVRV